MNLVLFVCKARLMAEINANSAPPGRLEIGKVIYFQLFLDVLTVLGLYWFTTASDTGKMIDVRISRGHLLQNLSP